MKAACDVETCDEVLAMWDSGLPVWSVEMGGLGPGYEQCIQLLAFEILRAMLAAGYKYPNPVPKPDTEASKAARAEWDKIADPVIHRLDSVNHFSGAQVGAAGSLAGQWLRQGYKVAIDCYPQSRKILVSKSWPHVPDEGAKP